MAPPPARTGGYVADVKLVIDYRLVQLLPMPAVDQEPGCRRSSRRGRRHSPHHRQHRDRSASPLPGPAGGCSDTEPSPRHGAGRLGCSSCAGLNCHLVDRLLGSVGAGPRRREGDGVVLAPLGRGARPALPMTDPFSSIDGPASDRCVGARQQGLGRCRSAIGLHRSPSRPITMARRRHSARGRRTPPWRCTCQRRPNPDPVLAVLRQITWQPTPRLTPPGRPAPSPYADLARSFC